MNQIDKQTKGYAPWTIYKITCRDAETYGTARINETRQGEGGKRERVHSGLLHKGFPKVAW